MYVIGSRVLPAVALLASIALGPFDGGVSAAAGARAQAARTITLNESSNLRCVSKHHFTLNEVGTATGTVKGTIHAQLTAVSTSKVTASVDIELAAGSISGHGTASYKAAGAITNFSGSISISHGSGSYARADGSGLRFSGTIQRSNEAVTVHMSGRISD